MPGPTRGLHRWALGLAVLLAAALAVTTWQDSGAWALVLLGVPVALSAAAYRGAPTASSSWLTGAAGVLVLVWAVLLAQGIGLFFLPVAVLLGLAAFTETEVVRR